jgi:hypothetical protein
MEESWYLTGKKSRKEHFLKATLDFIYLIFGFIFFQKYKYFTFWGENHVLNKIPVNVTIDIWQFIKLRRTFSEILLCIAPFLLIVLLFSSDFFQISFQILGWIYIFL